MAFNLSCFSFQACCWLPVPWFLLNIQKMSLVRRKNATKVLQTKNKPSSDLNMWQYVKLNGYIWGVMKRGWGTWGTFKAFNLMYLHVLCS